MKKKTIGSVKLLSCLLTAGMLAIFSACGNNDTPASGSQTKSSENVGDTSESTSGDASEGNGNGAGNVPEGTADGAGGSSQEPPGDIENKMLLSDMVLGQITAIEGQNITLDLAEMPAPAEGNDSKGNTGIAELETLPEKPEGEAATQQPAENQTETDNAEGAAPGSPENAVRIPEGEVPADAARMEFRLTGESRTITVQENTIITINGEEAALEALSVGDKITVVMKDDVVESINAQNVEQ